MEVGMNQGCAKLGALLATGEIVENANGAEA
jgi:hypothetical protein